MTATCEENKKQYTEAVPNGYPLKGWGIRDIGCNMYDTCLDKAAIEDWDGFNCEGCEYSGRSAFCFLDLSFVPDLADDIGFDIQENGMLDLIFSVQPGF